MPLWLGQRIKNYSEKWLNLTKLKRFIEILYSYYTRAAKNEHIVSKKVPFISN